MSLFRSAGPWVGGRVGSESGPWGPFLESPGNLPRLISVFGDKCFLKEVSFEY